MRRVLGLPSLTLLAILLLVTAPVQALTVLSSYSGTGGIEEITEIYPSGDSAIAQTFQNPLISTLKSASFQLARALAGSPSGNLKAILFTATASDLATALPNNEIARSNNVFDASQLTTTLVEYRFTFSGQNILSGTVYAIGIAPIDGTVDASNRVQVGTGSSSPTHPGLGASGGNGWGSLASGEDVTFSISGEDIGSGSLGGTIDTGQDPSTDQPSLLPVVGSSTLLILGIGVVAYLGLRGRKRGVAF